MPIVVTTLIHSADAFTKYHSDLFDREAKIYVGYIWYEDVHGHDPNDTETSQHVHKANQFHPPEYPVKDKP